MGKRRIIGARSPEGLMSYEEAKLGFPQQAFTGISQWVVYRVNVIDHEKGPLVIVGCQCPMLGLNGKRREACWSAWLKRSDGTTERRSKLDRALEAIYGALPPVDWPLAELIGVNFVASCRMETVEDNRTRAGYRYASYIRVSSIKRYCGSRKYLLEPVIYFPKA